MKKNLYTLVLFLVAISAYSIKDPIKYGNVTIDELKMKCCEYDTSASAMVLCDFGVFYGRQFQFTRNIRIKIFKKEGYQWGNYAFRIPSKSSIRACTYNLVNGKIEKTKLENESIFRERVSGSNSICKIAMPNVTEGSVIDIEVVHSGLPMVWYFQNMIPVKWSELRIEENEFVQFRKTFGGFESLAISEESRWVGRDMPSFKVEPYITSPENYLTRFNIDLLSINVPGVLVKEFTTNWEALNKNLLEDDNFGESIKGGLYINDLAKEIELKNSDSIARIKAAYEAIKEVKWNKKTRLYTTYAGMAIQLKEKMGNSADINLLLVKLLRKLDFKAYPVAMSTRDNGYLSEFFPSLNKLNYAIAYTKIGDSFFLLDATDELLPIGMLPMRALNGKGLLISESGYGWVSLAANAKEKESALYTLELDANLDLNGKMIYSKTEYAAYDDRSEYKNCNSSDEFVKKIEKNHQGLTIIESKLDKMDDIYSPLYEEFTVTLTNKVDVIGDMIFINPMFFEKISENPFKLEERMYPVDFGYRSEKKLIVTLKIPEGYQIVEIPKSSKIMLPENTGSFFYTIVADGNTISISCAFSLNKSQYLMHEYPNLKAFYDQVVKKHAEAIILKKI